MEGLLLDPPLKVRQGGGVNTSARAWLNLFLEAGLCSSRSQVPGSPKLEIRPICSSRSEVRTECNSLLRVLSDFFPRFLPPGPRCFLSPDCDFIPPGRKLAKFRFLPPGSRDLQIRPQQRRAAERAEGLEQGCGAHPLLQPRGWTHPRQEAEVNRRSHEAHRPDRRIQHRPARRLCR